MSFIIYDLSFLILFTLAVTIFLIIKRHNLKREGIMFLYRTKIGLKFIDYVSKKYPKSLRFLSYVIVGLGYILMILSVYFLVQIAWVFTKPELVKIIKIPPIMPLIPYLPELFNASWLPSLSFTYWIVAIAIVAIFHEGFHGIFAKFYKVKIKSTGFGFLGPFLAFFVEQDDKQMQKTKIFSQLTITAAGVFANVLLTIIFFILLGAFFNVAYVPSGSIFSDYSSVIVPVSLVSQINIHNESLKINNVTLQKVSLMNQSYLMPKQEGQENILLYHDLPAIRNAVRGIIIELDGQKISTNEDFRILMAGKKPGEEVKLKTKIQNKTYEYNFKLGADYKNESRAVIGVASYSTGSSNGLKGFISGAISQFKDPSTNYESKGDFYGFVYFLFWWLFMINFSVAVANMIPLGIFDGGRFFYLTILAITGKEKIAKKGFKLITSAILAIVALMMVFYIWNIF